MPISRYFTQVLLRSFFTECRRRDIYIYIYLQKDRRVNNKRQSLFEDKVNSGIRKIPSSDNKMSVKILLLFAFVCFVAVEAKFTLFNNNNDRRGANRGRLGEISIFSSEKSVSRSDHNLKTLIKNLLNFVSYLIRSLLYGGQKIFTEFSNNYGEPKSTFYYK